MGTSQSTLVCLFLGVLFAAIFSGIGDYIKSIAVSNPLWAGILKVFWFGATLLSVFVVLQHNVSWRVILSIALAVFLGLALYNLSITLFPGNPLCIMSSPIRALLSISSTRFSKGNAGPHAVLHEHIANTLSGILLILLLIAAFAWIYAKVAMELIGLLWMMLIGLMVCVICMTYLAYHLFFIVKGKFSEEIRSAVYPVVAVLIPSSIILAGVGIACIVWLARDYQMRYDAELESVHAPLRMKPGETKKVRVIVRNTGSLAWGQRYRYYALGIRDDITYEAPDFVLKSYKILPNTPSDRLGLTFESAGVVSSEVRTGGSTSALGSITAPKMPGTYWVTWQMVREGVVWFGQMKRTKIMVTG